MSQDDAISWRTIVYGMPVVAADGTRAGTVREVLGSDAEDIFHGLRVAIDGRPDAVLDAGDITSLTARAVTADKSAAEMRALPNYDETATYHVGVVGRLNKKLGWKRDSANDEEPG